MANNCKHIKCSTCGGVKLKRGFIGVTLNEVCSGKCLNAAKDACSCKCQGKFHQGNNSKLLDEILNPKKKKIVAKKVKKSVKKIQYFEPETIKDEVALFIQGKRFKTDSFDRFSDRNLRKDQKNLALNWLSKNGQSLDVVALDFLNLTNYNFDESYIIDLITEIILQYPSGIKQYIADAIEDKNNRLLAEDDLANQNYYSSVFDNEEQNKFETNELRFELNGVNKMKLKKGSAAARAFMAKIRAKKNKVGVVPARIKKVPADASTSTYKRDKILYAKLESDYNKYSGLYEDATASNKKILKAKLNKIEDAMYKYERKGIGAIAKTKKGVLAKRLRKDQIEYNKDVQAYKFFIVYNGNIESGWEYKSDAVDAASDYDGMAKILTLIQLKKLGFKDPRPTMKYTLAGFKKGNTRFIEKGEKPFKTKKTILVKRRITIKPKGTFKKFTTINGINKNMKKYNNQQLENITLTRVNNDVNGNPRYVLHFLEILNKEEQSFLPFSKMYDYALKKAKLIGGRKFHNKQYGGGIVFQSYNTDNLKENIIDVLESTPKIKY